MIKVTRIIGLDYGEKTVGLAISDELGWTAQALTTIRRKNEIDVSDTIAKIAEYVTEYCVETIVLGFPKNMNNSEGPRCEKTLRFKKQLEKRISGISVVLFDERLTTLAAERLLLEADLSRKKRNEVIDKMAAAQILQSYLNSLVNKSQK